MTNNVLVNSMFFAALVPEFRLNELQKRCLVVSRFSELLLKYLKNAWILPRAARKGF